MKITELRDLTPEDLTAKLGSLKEELSKLQYLRRVGQADKPHRFSEIRKTIARILTLLNEQKASKKKKG